MKSFLKQKQIIYYIYYIIILLHYIIILYYYITNHDILLYYYIYYIMLYYYILYYYILFYIIYFLFAVFLSEGKLIHYLWVLSPFFCFINQTSEKKIDNENSCWIDSSVHSWTCSSCFNQQTSGTKETWNNESGGFL